MGIIFARDVTFTCKIIKSIVIYFPHIFYVWSNEIWTIFIFVMCISLLFQILFPLSIFLKIFHSRISVFLSVVSVCLCVSHLIQLYWKSRNTQCIKVIRIVWPFNFDCLLSHTNIAFFKIYCIFRKWNIDFSLSPNTIWNTNSSFLYTFFPYCWIVPRNPIFFEGKKPLNKTSMDSIDATN